jgi:hypothetical protein
MSTISILVSRVSENDTSWHPTGVELPYQPISKMVRKKVE